jgi:uncharacterized protein (DUF952 family)
MASILHITTADQWEAAQLAGEYRSETLATEGFIHAAFPHQILKVADRFYHARPNLVVLVVNPAHLQAEAKYEQGTREADNNIEVFPHIYGPINLNAVVSVVPLTLLADGSFTLPDTIYA